MKMAMVAGLLVVAVCGATSVWGQTTRPGAGGGAAEAGGAEIAVKSATVPVKRVVLFSSGVGFFEHQGTVTGNATTELRFRTEQINDILKSLVVSDRDAGVVKNITYPSMEPVSRTLRSFKLDISGNPSLAELLGQMRGTKVKIRLADETMEGTIVGVEQKQRGVGGGGEKVVEGWNANLLTASGIRSVQLEHAGAIEIQDEQLRKELEKALATLAQARDTDKKPVVIHFSGQGERRVGIGYLIETPVWKTSYRLMLPEVTSKDAAKLQGWAIVENQTDNDWQEVSLELVGGRPISFIENLYQPLYVPRPVMQHREHASLVPQTYDAGIDPRREVEKLKQMQERFDRTVGGATEEAEGWQGGVIGGGATLTRGRESMGGLPASSVPRGDAGGMGGGGGSGGLFTDTIGSATTQPGDSKQQIFSSDFGQGVRSVAAANKVGEMFQYSVKGVSLPRQQSSMIPIVTEAIEFDRLSIYNEHVSRRHPLRGVRLKNKTDKYLLGGPITVMDAVASKEGQSTQAYAGDGKFDDLPAGQERLVSYAVDQEVLVNKEDDSRDERISASIVKGVLMVKRRYVNAQEFTLENKSERERKIVIETDRFEGYELKEPAKAMETTPTQHRFEVNVGGKKVGKFTVREEMVSDESVEILPMENDDLRVYVEAKEIPKKVRDVLAKVAAKRGEIHTLEQQRAKQVEERDRVLQEQGNIRENIKVLPEGSKTQQEAIADLGAREAELKAANAEIRKLDAAMAAARVELEKFVSEMTVE